MPTAAFNVFIMGTIVYWMTNLYDNARRYFILQGILILCSTVALSVGKLNRAEKICSLRNIFCFLGSLIGVAAPTPEAAATLVVPCVIPLLVFGGVFYKYKVSRHKRKSRT